MKTKLYLLAICLTITTFINAQNINTPNVEAVYGGRILSMAGYSSSSTTSRIFVSTESANSVFYADVTTPATGSSNFGTFTVMPTLSASANLGYINNIAAHTVSGRLFFTSADKLYSTSPTSTSNTLESSAGFHKVMIQGNNIFYVKNTSFYFGTLSSSGTITNGTGSPITMPTTGSAQFYLLYNSANSYIYIFAEGTNGTAPRLYKSSSAYTSFSSSTTFSNISPTTLPTTVDWRACGIAPSGRIFFGGHYNTLVTTKYIAKTDDETTWSYYNTGVAGVSGNSFAFSGSASSYYVYASAMYNNNKGDSGSWKNFGDPGGFETHPNDGDVLVDPNDTNTVYVTTDQGLGASVNRGSTIFEIDNGIEAVQVNDFSMTSDKKTAWIASKAGIRKVSNYQSTKSWSAAKFPNGDGSPYYSAEMKTGDTNTVYVGNTRIYKTTDGGTNWSRVFSAEDVPYNWTGVGYRFEAIEVCPWNTNLVVAGAYIDGTDKGGFFYSTDGGTNWTQQYLFVTSGTHDVDVWDVVFNLEGTDTIAYVGVDYDLSSPSGRSIYKLTKSSSGWTVGQDMNSGTTSTSTSITATVRDLHVSSTRDTVFACGTDAGVNHPIAYYKPLTATGKWTPFTTNGFPFTTGKQGWAITLGNDTVYTAVDNEVYYLPISSTTWYLGYSYPVGTQINFLYFDELLAGTATGLYGHQTFKKLPTSVEENVLSANTVKIYPNPFKDELKFANPSSEKMQVSLFDIFGKLVFENRNMNASESINTTGLQAGIYFVKLTGNNKTEMLKVVKN